MLKWGGLRPKVDILMPWERSVWVLFILFEDGLVENLWPWCMRQNSSYWEGRSPTTRSLTHCKGHCAKLRTLRSWELEFSGELRAMITARNCIGLGRNGPWGKSQCQVGGASWNRLEWDRGDRIRLHKECGFLATSSPRTTVRTDRAHMPIVVLLLVVFLCILWMLLSPAGECFVMILPKRSPTHSTTSVRPASQWSKFDENFRVVYAFLDPFPEFMVKLTLLTQQLSYRWNILRETYCEFSAKRVTSTCCRW